jgi:hypothetical protein
MSETTPTANIQAEVLDFLLTSPSPQEILDFHASSQAQERLRHLLKANRLGTLTSEERAELQEASNLNHFIMLLKARANLKLIT